MRKKSLASKMIGLFIIVGMSTSAMAASKIDPKLKSLINGDKETAEVTVLMALPKDVYSPNKYQREEVLSYLKDTTAMAWDKVSQYIEQDEKAAEHISDVKVHWINRSFTARVDLEGLKILAKAPGVQKVYGAGEITYITEVAREELTSEEQESWRRKREDKPIPYDLKDIRLDKVVKANRRINGRRVVMGMIDTGVDATHPLLEGKIKLFYDGRRSQVVDKSYDRHGHGTHVAGTILGGDYGKNFVGVAPKAQLIAGAGLVGSRPKLIKTMEFMLDPDGNPETNDAPRAVSNSWHSGYGDQELFYRAISAWEAAGIIPVFSAGNGGQRRPSITHPKEHPATIAVGATQQDGKIASFSSKGPTKYKGIKVQKPDLTAPGKDIVSSLPGRRNGKGRMSKMSGTSMAAPHVTGAIALMLQVNKRLRPDQVKQILKMTARATDINGNFDKRLQRKKLWRVKSRRLSDKLLPTTWNEVYGNGKLDVYDAVRLAGEFQSWFWQRRSRLILKPLNSFASLNLGLEEDVQPEDARSIPTVEEAMRFPKEWEGDEWLSSDDLFNQ